MYGYQVRVVSDQWRSGRRSNARRHNYSAGGQAYERISGAPTSIMTSMEQTVTVMHGTGYNYELFDSELSRVREHVVEMTNAGWLLIATEMADRTNTPIMMFWRRA